MSVEEYEQLRQLEDMERDYEASFDVLRELEEESEGPPMKLRKKLDYEDDSCSSQEPPTSATKAKRNKRERPEDTERSTTLINLVDDTTKKVKKPVSKVGDTSPTLLPLLERSEPKYSRLPLEGPSVVSTSLSGERTFIELKSESVLHLELSKIRRSGNLLATPISYLLDTLHQEKFHEIGDTPLIVKERTPKSESQLWVEKYAPHKFTDLLSDEQTNRKLLGWLKSWDECVFGKANKKPASSPVKGKQAMFSSPEKKLDKRPQYKAVLLSGPPGAGKTTLAHVIARHAGYNPVEINASDDRTAAIFESKIRNAVEMKANWIGDNRPNCLVIDEIDGVTDREGESAIETLIKILQSEDKEKTKGKSKKQPFKLSRPIICICNNQYVPALRKLRSVALVHNFEKPKSIKLAQRLKEICRQESLSVDTQTLTALCDLTECDIRACLNTLQFLSSKTRFITSDLFTSSAIGHKDMSKNLFELWREIFQKQPPKQTALNRIIHQKIQQDRALMDTLGFTERGDEKVKVKTQFEGLFETLECLTDHQKTVEGCYENFLSIHYNDPMLSKTTSCFDWMGFYDSIQHSMFSGQHYELTRYIHTAPLALHSLCATTSTPTLKFPMREKEFRKKHDEHLCTIKSFLIEVPSDVYRHLNVASTAMDFISIFYDVLTPSIRPLNSQILNPKEKKDLADLIAIMTAFRISYKAHEEKGTVETGINPVWKMDPNLESLLMYEGFELVKHRQLLPIQQQLISEELRRGLLALKAESAPSTPVVKVTKPPVKKAEQTPEKAKTPTKQEVTTKDFFGRVVKTPPKDKSPAKVNGVESLESNGQPTHAFRYKFHEGFTNAVRRTVYMKDLL